MSDKEKRAHELALQVVSEILSHDYNLMKNSDHTGDAAREVLAASVLDEYNYFFDAFKNSIQ